MAEEESPAVDQEPQEQPQSSALPYLPEDAAKMVPMIPFDQVSERQRLQDLKAFRQFLVDKGTVKCLMKLYQHTAQQPMQVDDPTLLKTFLGRYEEDGPDQETAQVMRENAELHAREQELEQECDKLERELEMEQWLRLGNKVWRLLAAGGDESMEMQQLYERLCGLDFNDLRPQRLAEAEDTIVKREEFSAWATSLPEALRVWLRETLEPKLRMSGDSPVFERALKQGKGMDHQLQNFIEQLASRFGTLDDGDW